MQPPLPPSRVTPPPSSPDARRVLLVSRAEAQRISRDPLVMQARAHLLSCGMSIPEVDAETVLRVTP